jgi:C4-dicarboxylate-specific signal transduction histidine kinase
LLISSQPRESGEVLVAVQDWGIGVDQQNMGRLFEPFCTTKPEGMGLGLRISRSIIEAHGGRLSAAANQPRGAAFRFTLPVEEQSSEDARYHRVDTMRSTVIRQQPD